MAGISALVIEADDATAAEAFHKEAFDLGDTLRVRESQAPTSGFRGFTLSLVVSQPSTVDALARSALDAGATEVKPAKRSFWGYGAAVQAPDGTLWTIASSSKKDSGPATREVDEVVLLLGVEDVKATKEFYTGRGLAVGKSFGSKYVELDTPGAAVKLALYSRKAAAKNAGVAPEGSGSHRLVILGDIGSVTDPDGFVWEAATA
jgi:predicted lactoylglutathione lyase